WSSRPHPTHRVRTTTGSWMSRAAARPATSATRFDKPASILQRFSSGAATMTGTTRLMTFAASAMAVAMLHPAVAQDRATAVRQEIRHELLQLPYYSVFDFLAFKYDRGTAVLMGYGYSPALKRDAERAVKRVPGVDDVRNQI